MDWTQWSSGGFTPAAFGDLVAGWEANYGITLNAGNVAAWVPKWAAPGVARSTLALTQGTASLQPALLANRGDGLPTVAFSAGAFLQNSTTVPPLVSTTGHMLLMQSDMPAYAGKHALALGSGDSQRAIDLYRTATLSNYVVTAGGITIEDVGAVSTGFRVTTVTRQANTGTLTRDTTSDSKAFPENVYAQPTMFFLGSYFGGSGNLPLSVSALWLYASNGDASNGAEAMKRRWPNYG